VSNPTNPFSWQMPTPTDLVTDLPADFEVFGQAVATSLADLLGGTSGQILAKNSNTDMDFVWIANDQGDITGITASSPLTGGGTSGAVTVGIQDATTAQKGAVQLENSTSSTSTTTAAVPASVKSAYDLANGAIPKSLIDAAGDLIVGTAADTAGRLGIGTAGQVLKVNSGATALEWGTAGGSGKVLQVVSGTYSTSTTIATSSTWTDTGLSLSITPTSATSQILVMVNQGLRAIRSSDNQGGSARIVRGATTIFSPAPSKYEQFYLGATGSTEINYYGMLNYTYLDSPATTSATTYKTQAIAYSTANSGSVTAQIDGSTSSITLLEIGA
jgi:hypothetical protein